MATLNDVVDGLNAYFGASDQDAPNSAVMELFAHSAIDAINEIRRYEEVDNNGNACVEDKYLNRAVRIAVYLCNKQGVDGTVAFSENGISQSFESGDIPPSLLKSITPVCKGW